MADRKLIIMVYYMIFFVSSRGMGQSCDDKLCDSVHFPLLDNMNAPLVANLDFSKFSSRLKIYIDDEIKKGIETAVKVLVSNLTQEKLADVIKRMDSHMEEKLKMLEARLVNESKIISDNKEAVAPTDIGFHAELSNTITLSSTQTLNFERVITNIGNGYNNHTGMFTATDNGLYFFMASFIPEGSSRAHLEMIKNSVVIARGRAHGSGSMQAVVKLMTGDVVRCRHWSGSGTETVYKNFSFFSGYLIN
ncbi:complement C1q-like protein 2 [Mytilus californianus]|uniref:complement C1q-like protein 2 n=1 Tax=Mytilus californianus TaxID=6549 RepID=UPI0022484F42|nr:complement C1q-like protein 2 [Mytilus californianus]